MVASILLKPAVSVTSALYPPLALAVSAYYLLPYARWPWVALVTLVFDSQIIPMVTMVMTGGRPTLAYSVGVSLSTTLIAGGMVAALRISRLAKRENQPHAVLAPLLVIFLSLGAMPGDLLSTWLHAQAGHQPVLALDVAIRNLSSLLTVVSLCPLIVGLLIGFDETSPPVAGRREMAYITLALLFMSVLYFVVPWTLDRFLELMLLAGPLLWLALRCSQRAIAIVNALVALAIGAACAHGLGRFPALVSLGNWRDGILSAQVFLLIICGEALLINRIVLKQRALLEDSRRKQTMLIAYGKALDEAEDSARRAAARDLHDGVAQIIAGQGLILGALRRRTLDTPLNELVDQALAASREALATVRVTIEDLSPPEMEHASLHQILAWITESFAQRYHFAVKWTSTGDPILASGHLRFIYRAVRELVYNSYKHSQSDTVKVQVALQADGLQLSVSDQGIGFDAASPPQDGRRRLGLVQLMERVAVAGGTMETRAGVGNGCRITIWLPRLVVSRQ
jgi:signal transduction histidine kinase